jgi:hypothetical protein
MQNPVNAQSRLPAPDLHRALSEIESRMFDLEQRHGHFGAESTPDWRAAKAELGALRAELMPR